MADTLPGFIGAGAETFPLLLQQLQCDIKVSEVSVANKIADPAQHSCFGVRPTFKRAGDAKFQAEGPKGTPPTELFAEGAENQVGNIPALWSWPARED